MNSRPHNGFTLIEVIVTAVIVVILSGVAIPNYIGYINQTRQDAVESLAATVAIAANTHWRKNKTVPTLSGLGINYDATKYTVTVNNPTDSVKVIRIGGTETKTISFK